MKEVDRRGGMISRLMGWGFFLLIHGLLLALYFQAPEEELTIVTYVGMLLLSSLGCCWVFVGYYSAPRAFFSEEGVYIQRFIRRRFFPWSDIQEAVVLEQNARSRYGIDTYYRFFLLTSKGTQWRPGDTEKTYRQRNRRNLLHIPLTNESREYVRKYYGKLFIDEAHGKKILWRLVK